MLTLAITGGVQEVLKGLQELERHTRDWRPFFERYGTDHLRPKWRAWMDSEGSGQWAPLSPRYAAYKAQRYPGKKILQREGTLRQESGAYGITRLEERQAEYGTSAPSAIFHQCGTRTMPQRQVVVFDAEDKKALIQMAAAYMAEMAREVGVGGRK